MSGEGRSYERWKGEEGLGKERGVAVRGGRGGAARGGRGRGGVRRERGVAVRGGRGGAGKGERRGWEGKGRGCER